MTIDHHDPRVRKYELILNADDRLDRFDPEVILRTYLSEHGFTVLSLRPTDGRPTYAETLLTAEDETALLYLHEGAGEESLRPEPTADNHDCRDEAPCYGHPDCKYAICEDCGRPN